MAIAHENWENTTNDADYPITKSVGMGISTQKNDTLWEILPGKADKTQESYISIESYNKPGLYLTARGEELVLTQDASRADSKGITQDSEAMTFRTLKGFAGYGVTLESVAMPGYFVTSEGGKLTLSQNPDLESATFTMIEEAGGTEEGAVPLAVYDFENGIGEGTQALVTGLGSYSNEVVYGEGRESGKAIKLGDYGLKLAQENLGENYTVSLWVKPDGNIQTNTPVLFLGYHDPEKWVSVSGENNNSFCKVWTKDENAGLNWVTVASGSIPAGEWTQLTLTQKGSTLTAYLNGVAIGSGTAARALSGENQGIYLGVNNWDAEFKGLIDDVKIYNQVLEPEEIQKENQEYYEEKLRETVEENLQQEELLGNKNASSQETLYDLALPSDLDGLPITWTSSEPSIISESGKVKNPAQATAVTLMAEVVSGILRAQKSFTFTVQPMDRTALEQKLSQAQQLSISPYMTEASVDALRKAMEEAQTADSQTEADKAVKKLQRAMDALAYKDEYLDPFPFLEGSEPAASAQLKEKDGLKLFEIPASIRDMVTVSYESSSPVVASYEDGTVTALKAGTTILTTVVTAKYDGYAVRYRTKITVTAQTQGTQKPPVTDPGNDQAKPAPDLSKVVVKAAKTKLAKGGSTKVNVTLPSDVQAASPKVTYKANGAVTVTSAGKIRAKKPGKGTVTVTVTADGRSISKKLSISVGAITGKSSVKAGKAITLKVKGITGKVKWSVNKKKLATIGKKGKLTAKKKGKIVVTAKVAGVTMKKSIRIR